MGKETVARIKYLAEQSNIPRVLFLGLDIDKKYSTDVTKAINTPDISVNNPAEQISVLSENESFLQWWPKGYTILTSLSGSTGAGQIRINGRFALYARYSKIKKEISEVINQAKSIAQSDPNDKQIFVFLISSLGGGTGAGIFLDVSFIIRNELGSTHRLYGVFYDGTITKQYEEKTLNFSYAALSEIEYWLQYYKNYNMEFSDGNELSGENFKTRFFDIVFLVQSETSDQKRFVETEKGVSPYIPMVVESLFSLISIPDFKRYTAANNWNRFDNLNIPGMQIRYGSFSIGTITYDEEKVLSFITNRLVYDFILDPDKRKDGDLMESFEDSVEDPLEICERKDQSLTIRGLRTLPESSNISSRLERFSKKLNIISKKEETQKLKSQFQIPIKSGDNTRAWNELLDQYREATKKFLFNKKQEVQIKIRESIEKNLKTNVLYINELSDWLNTAKGVIEKNTIHVEKYKRDTERTGVIQQIEKRWTTLLKDRTIFGKLKIEHKSAFSSAVTTWIKREISRIEHRELKSFFEDINNEIETWKLVVSILSEKIGKVRTSVSNEIGKYTGRDTIYNMDSLSNQEFPLHIKLDLNRELTEKYILKSKILESENLFVQLTNIGGVIHAGSGDLKGIKDHFEFIRKEIDTNREKEVRGNNTIEQNLRELFTSTVKEIINKQIYSIRIDDILEYWLSEQIYPIAKKAYEEKDDSQKLRIKESWSISFGENGAEALLADQYFSDPAKKEEWLKVALKYFILNFKEKINPFVRLNEQIKKLYWNKISLDSESRNAFSDRVKIFVPENFKFSKIIKKDTSETLIEIKSGHNKIKVFAETYAFPLHSLDLIQGLQEDNIREQYLEHREIMRKDIERNQINHLIQHIDKRFYTDWRIDIARDETKDIVGYWLYILGLGLDFIQKDKRKKFVLIIDSSKKTISQTLPKTLNEIKQNNDLRETLKNIVRDSINSIYFREKNFDQIENILKRAYTLHKTFKPVRTDANKEAYQTWLEIEENIKVLASGDFAKSSNVPKNWNQMKKLLDSL